MWKKIHIGYEGYLELVQQYFTLSYWMVSLIAYSLVQQGVCHTVALKK